MTALRPGVGASRVRHLILKIAAACLCILYLAHSIHATGQETQPTNEGATSMPSLDFREPLLNDWLRQALAVPDREFLGKEVYRDLLIAPFHESRAGIGIFLKRGFDPYRGVEGVEWRAHAAKEGGIDLLRCAYEVEGVSVTLTESNNFLLVRVGKQGENFSELPDTRPHIRDLVDRVVNSETADHRWSFQIPAGEGAELKAYLVPSTGAPLLRDLMTRHDRADILILDQQVYFVFYKKIAQLEDYLPSDRWFSPEARAALLSRSGR